MGVADHSLVLDFLCRHLSGCGSQLTAAAPSALACGDRLTAPESKRPGEQGLLSSAAACSCCTVRGNFARQMPESVDKA